jgi:hypothetical protein
VGSSNFHNPNRTFSADRHNFAVRDDFRRGGANREQFQTVDAHNESGPTRSGRYGERRDHHRHRRGHRLEDGLTGEEGQIFAGKLTKPEAEDPDTVNHLNWYMATGFKWPYPGEKTVRQHESTPKGRGILLR